MFDKLFNSIVFRIGSMMFLISFVSIISMFSSVFISEMAEHDALIINDAGSLRKQSYKIFAELELLPQIRTFSIEQYQDRLNQSIDSFTVKIDSPLMHTQVDMFTNDALLLSLGEIKEILTLKLQLYTTILIEMQGWHFYFTKMERKDILSLQQE